MYNKIEEVAENQYKADPKKYKTSENALKLLPFHFQAIYFSRQFEMMIEIGDCHKFFDNSFPEDIEIIAKSYRIFGFQSLSDLMLELIDGNYEVEAFEEEFNHIKDIIQKTKIDYIRDNAGEFELN